MNSYCLSCKKDTENINPKIVRTKNNRLMMLSKCAICNNEKSRFIKEQEARGERIIKQFRNSNTVK